MPRTPAVGAGAWPRRGQKAEKSALDEMRELVRGLNATETKGMPVVAAMALAREKRLAILELANISPPPPLVDRDFSQTPEWYEFTTWMEDWMKDRDLLEEWRTAVRDRLAKEKP